MKMNEGQDHVSNMPCQGTPFYTPEVVTKGKLTKAADIFSLGIMLWELVSSCSRSLWVAAAPCCVAGWSGGGRGSACLQEGRRGRARACRGIEQEYVPEGNPGEAGQ
jgi:hypothetical protein